MAASTSSAVIASPCTSASGSLLAGVSAAAGTIRAKRSASAPRERRIVLFNLLGPRCRFHRHQGPSVSRTPGYFVGSMAQTGSHPLTEEGRELASPLEVAL